MLECLQALIHGLLTAAAPCHSCEQAAAAAWRKVAALRWHAAHAREPAADQQQQLPELLAELADARGIADMALRFQLGPAAEIMGAGENGEVHQWLQQHDPDQQQHAHDFVQRNRQAAAALPPGFDGTLSPGATAAAAHTGAWGHAGGPGSQLPSGLPPDSWPNRVALPAHGPEPGSAQRFLDSLGLGAELPLAETPTSPRLEPTGGPALAACFPGFGPPSIANGPGGLHLNGAVQDAGYLAQAFQQFLHQQQQAVQAYDPRTPFLFGAQHAWQAATPGLAPYAPADVPAWPPPPPPGACPAHQRTPCATRPASALSPGSLLAA